MELTDSIVSSNDVIKNCLDYIGEPTTITFGFAISVILLLLISFLKVHISNKADKSEFLFMFVEMPIDVCVIIITTVATGYMISGSEPVDVKRVRDSLFLILVSLVVAAACCGIRRQSLKQSENKGSKNIIYSVLWGCSNIFIGVMWSYYIISFLVNNG